MTNPLQDLITAEDGVFVFNDGGSGGVFDISPTDAGRAAAGLRLAQTGKVNRAELSVNSESNSHTQYRWNRTTQQLDEFTLRPTINGAAWQPTGRVHPGYLQHDDATNRDYIHTPAAHFAVLFAVQDRTFRCPITSSNKNAVEMQIKMAGMTEPERLVYQATQSERVAVRV